MKTEDFNIKFREKIEKGVYKVTFKSKTKELPARIICWDRKGVVNDAGEDEPIVALVTIDDGSEILMEATANGHAWCVQEGSHQALYVTYQDLPTKNMRVKYSLMKHSDFLDFLMGEYGFDWDDDESAYTNEVRFINSGAVGKNLNKFYLKLKENGYWDYDDEEDWNLDFKPGDSVICKNNEGPWALTVGELYKVIGVGCGRTSAVAIKSVKEGRSLSIAYEDFIDMFRHDELGEMPKYDFTKMKPFTPVLARTGDCQAWFPHFFESYHPQNHGGEFYMIDNQHAYSQCVPYEGNAHLLRTQDPIPPYYDIRK